MANHFRHNIAQLFDAIAPAIWGDDRASTSVGSAEVEESWQTLRDAAARGQLSFFQQLIVQEKAQQPNSDKFSLLMEAADKGQTAIARLLLESGADIHIENNFQETALDLACAKGWVESVQMLVEAGADVNRRRRDTSTPLIIAAASPARLQMLKENGCLYEGETPSDIDNSATQIVRILLAAGADPNMKSFDGKTPLLLASAQGLTEMVEELLAANADVNLSDENSKDCNTPLIAAIEMGHPQIARLLLDAGANALEPNGNGIAPIDLANGKGLSEIVTLLQDRGVSPDAETAATTALIGAARSGDLAALKVAISAGAALDSDDRGFPKGGLTALMYAVQAGHQDVIEELIAAGADVNRHDARQLPWHKTALMYAVESNRLEIVQLLLQAGADPNASDRLHKPGRTPLIYAALEDNAEIVEALLSAGANATIKDRKGNTALHCAYGNLAIVKMLLAAGADPYEVGQDDSPIESASLMGHGEIVQLMLKSEPPDPEQAKRSKSQALEWAASNNDLVSIRELIEAGVDINVQSTDGYDFTPLMTAVTHGHFEAVKFLVNAGADLAATNDDGHNSLSLAFERGQLDIARWLIGVGATLPEKIDTNYLLIATIERGENALQMLLELGVDLNACDEDGETALSLAVDRYLPEVVQFLIKAGIDLEKHGPLALGRAIENNAPEIAALLEKAGVQRE